MIRPFSAPKPNPSARSTGPSTDLRTRSPIARISGDGCSLTSTAVAIATQATGTVMIFEKMFENRLFFVDKLVAMGARIVVCDPHRVVISGPAQLYGERLESPDIRAGMAMLIAALCADGRSEIGNIRQIDRGYERIDERLRALGARIERQEVLQASQGERSGHGAGITSRRPCSCC